MRGREGRGRIFRPPFAEAIDPPLYVTKQYNCARRPVRVGYFRDTGRVLVEYG